MGTFIKQLGNLGMSLLGNAAGMGMGMINAKANDKRQLEQQQKLQDMQIAGNKQMVDYQKMKDYEMWQKTSYPGQIEMMKKAGLNPALAYGMAGGGGAITGGSGGVSGGTAQQNPGEITSGMGMVDIAQVALLDAQRKNIEADTKNKEASTQNTQVDTGVKGVQENLLRIEQEFREETYKASVKKNHYETNLAMHDAALRYEQLMQNVGMEVIVKEQAQANLNKTKEEIANLILSGIKTTEDTKLTQAQVSQVLQNIQNEIKRIQQGDRALDQKDQDILIDKARNELIEKGIWVGAASNIAGDLIKILTGRGKTVINDNRKNITIDRTTSQ